MPSSSGASASHVSEICSVHKCFMCGTECVSDAALDQHVILCAKGQLLRRDTVMDGPSQHSDSVPPTDARMDGAESSSALQDAAPPAIANTHADQSDAASTPPQPVEPSLDTLGSHDHSLELPSAVLTSRSFDASMPPSGGCSPALDQSMDAGRPPLGSPIGDEGGTGGSSSMSPKQPRRRRAHTAHEDPEDAAERINRRCLMEEQLLSLESMQLANQERLRRSATATTPTMGDGVGVDTPPLSTSSSQAGRGIGGMRAGIALLKSPTSGSFSRHHSNVLWTERHGGETTPMKDTTSPVHSPAGQLSSSGRGVAAPPVLSLRGSLERSSSAMVMPSSSSDPSTRQPSKRHADPVGDTLAPSPVRALKRPPMRLGTGAQRTLSSDARRATASPQPPSRRSSTVASRKGQQQTNRSANHNGSVSLNSSVEMPRTEPPAPVPRASTTVRQRASMQSNASRLASLLPQRSSASGKQQPAAEASTPTTASGVRGVSGSATTGGTSVASAVQNAVRGGGPASSKGTHAGGTVPWSSTFSNKSGAARRTADNSIGGSAPVTGTNKAKASHPPTAAAAGGAFHMTTSTGSVTVGGHVPPPRHSTLRPPNPSKKLLTTSAPMPLHAMPPVVVGQMTVRSSAVLPPPPPVRQSSLSMSRSSPTPDRAASMSASSPPGIMTEGKAVFCAECGMKYVDRAKFCAFCGHRREAFATA